MRKHRVPFGWPRRNPRHSRFPLPNAVWEYQLKPIAFVILSYLCNHSSHGNTDNLTPEVIANGIHKTESTVRNYLSALEDAGLVTGQYSITADLLSSENGKFFTLPNEIFLLNLPPSAFMVYAYLLLIEDRRTHTCHPSYNTIAAVTGMSRNTVIKTIGVLLEKHLVTMEHSHLMEHDRVNQRSGHGNPGLSSTTVRSVHLMLHSAFERAVKERLIPRNPTDDCIAPKV